MSSKAAMITLLVLVSSLSGCIGNTDTTDLETRISDLESAKDDLQNQFNNTTADFEARISALESQINAANDSVNWSWMDLSNFYHPYPMDSQILDLSNANLSHTNLREADLSYANLSHADLSYAWFLMSNLSYTDLSYANLSNATNLFSVDLTGVTWHYTICPDGTNTGESGSCV